MYLMIFFIVVTIVSCIIAIICYNIYEKNYNDLFDVLSAILIVLTIVFFITSIVCGCICISENVNTDAKIARYEAEREALVYQIENETYLNDNNMGTYELFKDVSKFNKDVLSGKIGHENPWYSWFYGEYYKYIEPISFNK